MLTKSNYLSGLQCPKLLWILKNDKSRIPELTEMGKAKFKEGYLIEEFAKSLFPNGIDLSKLNFKEQLEKTNELLEKRVPLFEASFSINDLYARADILLPTGDNHWNILEIKSATKIKDVNFDDLAFQKYVYEKDGLKIRSCFIMHVNSEYVRQGEIEPKEFILQTDVSEKVEEASLDIEKRVNNMLKIINSKEEPKCSIGVHCSKPYDCPIKGECWEEVPEESVFEFRRMFKKKCFELYDSGIKKLNEVPDSVKLNDKQKIQRLVAENKETHINKDKIKYFLDNLQYPVYYLDFETINPAVPKFDNSKPYQQIPFQYSLHVQEEPNGELKHISFLAKGTSDPRPKFLQSLKENLGDKGDILVYNQSFEKMIFRQGAEFFTEFQDWHDKNILPRIKDLMEVFNDFHYYNPKQKGSVSIKYVLPVLSNLSYSDLDIKKGDVAQYEFDRITYGDVSDEEKQRVREALGRYCELDTLAEVEIVNGLKGVV